MKSWTEIEPRIRALASRLSHLRLDVQTGCAGEYLRLAGGGTYDDERQFKTLAAMCGQMLGHALPKNHTILMEPDYEKRWFRVMQTMSGTYSPDLFGTESNSLGVPSGTLFLGSIRNIVSASADMCLTLQMTHPVGDMRPWHERLYEDYGKTIAISLATAIIGTAGTAIWAVFFS